MTDQNLMRAIVKTMTPEFLEDQGIVPLSVDDGTLLLGTWRDEVSSDTLFQLESLFSARIRVTPTDRKSGREAIRRLFTEPVVTVAEPELESLPEMSEPIAPITQEEVIFPTTSSPIAASTPVTEPLRIENVEARGSNSFPAIDEIWPDVEPVSVTADTVTADVPVTNHVDRNGSERTIPLAPTIPLAAEWPGEEESVEENMPAPGTLRALANEPSVVRLVGQILNEAIKRGASEVRFESQGDSLRVRYQVGEESRDALTPPRSMAPAVMSRLKNMVHLDLSERRMEQEGTVRLALAKGAIDMRIVVTPSSQGETLVVHLTDVKPAKRELEMLGMSPADLARFEKVIMQRRGMVLVTGPAGSGKTNTLYAALRRLNRDGAKILTVEEPVAYHLDGVTQVPVNERSGVTYASALRVMLRQEPDVIFVGELRDADTAEVATQTALMGQLVMSTIVATDAVDALTNRLGALGVAPFLVAGSVEAVVAQRIVRTVCPICGTGVAASEPDRASLGITNRFQIMHGVGCDACDGSGYLGNAALFEVLVLDDAIRAAISGGAGSAQVMELARGARITNLRDDGTRLVLEGVTTPEEVVRVTQGMNRQVVTRSGRVRPVAAAARRR